MIYCFCNFDSTGRDGCFINIRELAKLAGVSIATVSRVINNPQLVQPETREHVRAVMREANYSPPRAPGNDSDSDNRSHTIVFLFSDADYGFYEQIRGGIEFIIRPRQYTLLLCPVESDPVRCGSQIETICRRRPDGVIYALRDFHKEHVASIRAAGIPLVLARKYDHATELYNCCYVNFAEGSYRMTKHLIGLGHRKIILLVEKVSFQFVASFCEGWRRAYAQSGLPCEEGWIVHTPNTVEGGYTKVRELLEEDSAPDAFFCASGEMAFGAMRAARALNVPVPARLAIAGFTDTAIAQLLEPQLTTIDQSIRQLGIVSAQLMFEQIDRREPALTPPQEIVLQPKLQIRQSCGSP